MNKLIPFYLDRGLNTLHESSFYKNGNNSEELHVINSGKPYGRESKFFTTLEVKDKTKRDTVISFNNISNLKVKNFFLGNVYDLTKSHLSEVLKGYISLTNDTELSRKPSRPSIRKALNYTTNLFMDNKTKFSGESSLGPYETWGDAVDAMANSAFRTNRRRRLNPGFLNDRLVKSIYLYNVFLHLTKDIQIN